MTNKMTLKELLDKHKIGLDKEMKQAQAGLEGALYRWGQAIEGRDTRRDHWEKVDGKKRHNL